jgi:hypothetical protein
MGSDIKQKPDLSTSSAKKRGRPRQYEDNIWFGMKVTPEERQRIKTLAALEGKSATRMILDMVNKRFNYKTGHLTSREIMQLSEEDRNRILEAQAKKARTIYRELIDE